MLTVHRKTAKGIQEIAHRSNRLGQRLRAALIMINGQVSDEELLPLLGADGERTLRTLREQGYIEPVPQEPASGNG